MSLAIENLKFTIFGAGHDYTLADSGKGDIIFFSHPYVPLNSVNYAGQYYFELPVYDENDETAEPVITDVVKDDIAHCTFTPDLGTTFSSEGETEVKVEYYREYIYSESTIVVQKTLTQTIEVVDHGAVSSTSTNLDVYSDGYAFIRPDNVSTVENDKTYALSNGTYTKCSSIPWRALILGAGTYGFLSSPNLTDISELEYADVSNCVEFKRLFYTCSALTDISALEGWDVSKVEKMDTLFSHSGVTSLENLTAWNVSNLLSLEYTFYGMNALESLKGLENWDVSNVTTLNSTFSGCSALADISALADWDVSNVTTLQYTFYHCDNLESLNGLENWDVSNVVNMSSTFNQCGSITSLIPLSEWTPKPTSMYYTFANCTALITLEGVERFDVSECTNFSVTFGSCSKLLNLNGVETWDTSSGTVFDGTFSNDPWVSDISAVANWSFASATNCSQMFGYICALLDLNDITFDLSNASNLGGMFSTFEFGYVAEIDKVVFANAYYYVDYEGNQYAKLVGQMQVYAKDASNAENWIVSGTGLNAFNSFWSNIPSWN